ncbi:MAG TPA: flagellar basal body-associated FliL family protein [Povalibacter sp.]|nr:flagellar basal body-associated FliL family protein [Povalibacter sp.]
MSEATATADAVAEKKSGSSLLVIVLVSLLAAAVAGGGVYFFAAAKGDTETAEKADAEKVPAKPKGPALYVKMDPPFVANFEAKGLVRFLQVSVEIMTRDPVTSELLKQHDPMIRNDLLMLFGNQQYENISTSEGKDRLRAQALEAVKKIIGQEGGDARKVEQLYFTSFVMQ